MNELIIAVQYEQLRCAESRRNNGIRNIRVAGTHGTTTACMAGITMEQRVVINYWAWADSRQVKRLISLAAALGARVQDGVTGENAAMVRKVADIGESGLRAIRGYRSTAMKFVKNAVDANRESWNMMQCCSRAQWAKNSTTNKGMTHHVKARIQIAYRRVKTIAEVRVCRKPGWWWYNSQWGVNCFWQNRYTTSRTTWSQKPSSYRQCGELDYPFTKIQLFASVNIGVVYGKYLRRCSVGSGLVLFGAMPWRPQEIGSCKVARCKELATTAPKMQLLSL